jgi:hypothetical protein
LKKVEKLLKSIMIMSQWFVLIQVYVLSKE